MKLSQNMLKKIWNARDVVSGMDGWVFGTKYNYRALKWNWDGDMQVCKYEGNDDLEIAWFNVKDLIDDFDAKYEAEQKALSELREDIERDGARLLAFDPDED